MSIKAKTDFKWTDLFAAIFVAYNKEKQICLQVFIVAEEWKQADSSEACRQAKVCL